MFRLGVGLQYRWAERSCNGRPKLTRKEPQVVGQEASSNGSHAEALGPDEARLTLTVPAGPTSVTHVRDALGDLIAEGDPVVLEQVAVLVGALTSGTDRPGAPPSAPFEIELRADRSRVVVDLYDRDFTAHRSEGGLVELERSMLTPWRLKLVERLADRWSVMHDELLVMRFEFDSEQGMTLRDTSGGS